MKRNVTLLILMILTIVVFAQKKEQKETFKLDEVEVTPPKFAGFENAVNYPEGDYTSLIKEYLRKNVSYPEEAVNSYKEGTEVVEFTVTPQGRLTNFNVINSVSPSIDEEVIRVLKSTNGMWKPGSNNDSPVEMEQEITLVFTDERDESITNHFVQRATYFFGKGSEKLMEENKPKRALNLYDQGIRYLPNDKSLLLMRGVCHYELGNSEMARRDWNRIAKLGGISFEEIDYDLVKWTGFKEMANILAF